MLSKAVLFSALVATVSSQALEDVLAEHDDRSLFVEYATGAGLVDEIAGLDAATIFAPTNEAFESILEDLPDLVNDDDDDSLTERLTNILMYHVIGSGTYVSSDISDFPGDFLPTLLDDMTVNPYVGEVAAVFSAEKRRSSITTPDLDYDNGVVHIIDKVMLPPNPPNATALDMGFLYFAGALQQLDLVADINTADQVTLFIPSDEAFTAVGSALQDFSTEELDALVKYHVVVGQAATTKDLSDGDSFETLADGNSVDIAANADDGELYVNNARVVAANILLPNGIAHYIDQVLNPADDYEYIIDYDNGDGLGVPAFDDPEEAEVPALTSGLPSPTNAYQPTDTFTSVSGASNVQAQAYFALFAIGIMVAFAM